MTRIFDRPSATAGAGRRTQLDLTDQQLRAIDAFNEARRRTEQAAAAGGSRERRMDLARDLDVLRRQHEALVDRVDAQFRSTGDSRTAPGQRVVLAHRNAWFRGKVFSTLHEHGANVVACLDNGADAIGSALAEQPDLVLVEDKIAMVPGEEVIRQLRRHCPGTVVAAHVDHGGRIDPLVEAGAHAVFTRQVPPADVAQALKDLLRD